MAQKVFYYRFNKIDSCALIIAVMFFCGVYYGITQSFYWALFALEILFWCIKHLLRHKCAVITDKYIKLDHSAPLAWKDVKTAKFKIVSMLFESKKLLVLIPKPGIKYHYSFLQKHNGVFGAFPIPLYGILSPQDEKEIISLVKKYVKK